MYFDQFVTKQWIDDVSDVSFIVTLIEIAQISLLFELHRYLFDTRHIAAEIGRISTTCSVLPKWADSLSLFPFDSLYLLWKNVYFRIFPMHEMARSMSLHNHTIRSTSASGLFFCVSSSNSIFNTSILFLLSYTGITEWIKRLDVHLFGARCQA